MTILLALLLYKVVVSCAESQNVGQLTTGYFHPVRMWGENRSPVSIPPILLLCRRQKHSISKACALCNNQGHLCLTIAFAFLEE